MKLTFKDLKQQKFVIEAEPSETIGQVKEKISKEKGWEVSQQKHIYSGKILQDANTVESYNIEEKGFIVCMIAKPKAAPAGSSSTSSSAKPPSTPAPDVAQTPAPPNAPAPASSSTPNPPTTPTPNAPSLGASNADDGNFNDPSALTLGAQRVAAVSNMESMGFPRADIDRAMRAAFFNPDRAVEYLLNGIPENVQQEQAGGGIGRRQQGTASAPAGTGETAAPADPAADTSDQPINLFEAAAQANRASSAAGRTPRQATSAAAGLLREGAGAGATGAGGLGNLDFLRNNPQFQQLRSIVQTQPHMLEPILQQVSAGNPQLAQLIGQNQEQFLQLLSEEADGDAPLPPGAQEISVTEEERAAIERLCLLGFERDMVIQAYFACDKNEELAANFLFEQPDDVDES
jgi:UV excision repair protein RAD23